MNTKILEANLRNLYFQRNVFFALAILLCIGIVVLSSFLFLKRERVIVAPPVIDREFWVDASSISPTYLEQFSLFISQLILTKSPLSASQQRTIVLRHTNPSFFNPLRQKLIEEEEMLKKQNVAYTFYQTGIKVDTNSMTAHLTGERSSFAGNKQISSQSETYILRFSYDGTRLLLSGIEAVGAKFDEK